ncbi:MAG: hypothetical protein MI861_08380, partial [Pirellulales bacterium]|nr:hypothetical protein [Pirellulales bacterium]
SSDPPLSVEELDTFLTMREQVARGEGPRTWLLLDPIDRSKYSRESRIRDLVLRMATVRSHRVQAAFVADPYDPDRGLLREDGRPEELFLPWRTTSRLLGNLRHVGSLQLRSGAHNAVYAGGERAVLLVWSDEPTEELIFLGDGAQAVDVWGRVTDLPVEEYRGQAVHRVSIGSEPSFIIGADPMLLAFRMSVSLSPAQLDSLLGQSQRLSVSFHNPTRQGLAGQLQLVQPDGWNVEASTRPWEMLGGRGGQHHFDLVLGNSAKIGSYEIPIRFEIQSVPPKRFTVYRPIHIGPAGLELKVTTKLVGGSDLRVRIEMTNRSPHPHTYDCLLFPPPGRQYQRRPSITIQPGETVQRDIFWRRGDELIGQKMFLRAVEQDGRRVVNYEINVTR